MSVSDIGELDIDRQTATLAAAGMAPAFNPSDLNGRAMRMGGASWLRELVQDQ
jgi:hypothetical protein